MRNILAIDIPAILRRGKSVEQFIGRSPDFAGHIRIIELRPSQESIEVWVYDFEDIGTENFLDLYEFPFADQDRADNPAATFSNPESALSFAAESFAADSARWVNSGVSESEYLDYIRAGRPSIRAGAA
nr:putative integron gene cassette protein [uncultured bacterium]